MIYAFKRRRGCQGCFAILAVLILAWVAGFSWFIIPSELWPLKWIFLLLAGSMSFAAIPGIVMDIFSPGPILVISIEGIQYLSFSRETVPWSAISSVTLTLGYWTDRQHTWRKRSPSTDSVSFQVIEPERFSPPPGALRVNKANLTVPILWTSVQASAPQIIDAVRSIRPDLVREVDSAPPPREQDDKWFL